MNDSLNLTISRRLTGFDFGVVSILVVLLSCSALLFPVNPWPVDGWYETSLKLFGTFPGDDNYAPISAPAVQYHFTHLIAEFFGADLRGEFYINCVIQNVLLLFSVCLVYFSATLISSRGVSAVVAIVLALLCVLTGVSLKHWSENVSLFLVASFCFLILQMHVELTRGSQPPRAGLMIITSTFFAPLVLTRMIPLIFIAGLGLLFYRRISFLRLAFLLGGLATAAVLLMWILMASNEQRFGRFELTNSTGRHLWQGVTNFADEALAEVPKYKELKAISPTLPGSPWWRVRFGDGSDRWWLAGAPATELTPTQRDHILKDLALQAILNDPPGYFRYGLKKFSNTIAIAPERVGYSTAKWSNPLGAEDFLPPLGSTYFGIPRGFIVAVEKTSLGVYEAFRIVYPVLVFFAMVSWIGMVTNRVKVIPDIFRTQVRKSTEGRLGARWLGLFIIPSVVIAWILSDSLGEKRAILNMVLCLALLVLLSLILRKSSQSEKHVGSQDWPMDDGILYSFLAAMFFVPLWVSWQLEFPNSRNAILYLPFLAMMVCVAINFWWTLARQFLTSEKIDRTFNETSTRLYP